MRVVVRRLVRIVCLVLAAGLICALLVRFSPGALVDERELNPHLGEDSLAALRAEKAEQRNIWTNLRAYFAGLSRGDLGFSKSSNAPIAQLIAERAPETAAELGIGLAGGWLLGFGLAIPVGRFRRAWVYDAASTTVAGLVLSLPTALIAYLWLVAGMKAGLVLVVVLAPRIFRFARNLLVQAYGATHVEMARARGLSEIRILWAHVLPSIGPQLLALAAASASMAIGAAIPIEAICDVPGLGRLAWQAAMARDLPLLVNLTMLVAVVTTIATSISDLTTSREPIGKEAAA
jgi:ABC-type dipeptide/oligopeptide/nickel transport system permease component